MKIDGKLDDAMRQAPAQIALELIGAVLLMREYWFLWLYI